MIEIGTCDYCGEFCAEVGLNSVESSALPNGWIPPSAIRRHRMWSRRRHECGSAGIEGGEGHLGPFHSATGRPLLQCPHCSSPSHDYGTWDDTLDHQYCPLCVAAWGGWAEVPWGQFMAPSRSGRHGQASALAELTDDDGDPRSIAISTVVADRARVEAAIDAYFGRDTKEVQWVSSPGALIDTLTAESDVALASPFPQPWSLWADAPDRVLRELLEGMEADEFELADAASARGLCAGIRRVLAVTAGHADAVGAIGDGGQFDVLTPFVAARMAGRIGGHGRRGFLRLMNELRAAAGPAIMLGDRVVVCERPRLLLLDDRERLHADNGPAIAYRDGFSAWVVHGVRVPEPVAVRPEDITVEAIDSEPNAEVRRVMIERFGAERLIRDARAVLIHEDERGRLWRRPVGPRPEPRRKWAPAVVEPEPLMMVEVRNATPEPDGTYRTYFLRVPPHMRTAHEAVAWTFEMDGAEYAPTRET